MTETEPTGPWPTKSPKPGAAQALRMEARPLPPHGALRPTPNSHATETPAGPRERDEKPQSHPPTPPSGATQSDPDGGPVVHTAVNDEKTATIFNIGTMAPAKTDTRARRSRKKKNEP